MLGPVDKALDEMSLLVEMLVVGDRLAPAGMRWDHGGGAERGDSGADAISVVGSVGDDVLARLAVEQGLGLGRVMGLAAGKHDLDQLTQAIDEEMQLAAQPAARTANRLSVRAPLPPAAC